jgi:hypothetical protein
MKTWTVAYDPEGSESGIQFKEVKAPTDVAAAEWVADNILKKNPRSNWVPEFYVFEGPMPKPIQFIVERSVKLTPKEADGTTQND